MWEGLEKRRFVRANFSCKIIVRIPAEREISTTTEDIGEGGVRIVLAEELKPQAFVGLKIYLENEPIICEGRVAWVVERSDLLSDEISRFDTGIEFYQIKDEDKQVISNFVTAILSKE